MSAAFQNLYWTRILSLQNPHQEVERHPLTDDVVEAWNELDEASRWDSLGHKVHFDPKDFANANPAPTKEEFQLDEEDLRHWGFRCTDLRANILERAKAEAEDSIDEEDDVVIPRSRTGLCPSRPSHNVEQLTEARLRERRLQEVELCRQYRPRRRRLLSLEEQQEIADSFLVELRSQKEIAHKFRVTRQLVRDLVAEARKHPEKRLKATRKEEEAERRHDAVKEAVQVLQGSGKPIRRA